MNTLTTLKSPLDNRDFTIDKVDDNFPEILDLKKMLPSIRNQGSQGSCAAHTAACMKEWQELQDVGFWKHMSPQFIYNNRENQDSEGMYPRDVMRILYNLGCCSEEKYPYGKIESPDNISDFAYNNAKQYKIKGYARIYTINGLKNALYKYGPCLLAVPVYNYGSSMWKKGPGETQKGGHAMTIVGYDEDGFIIRNSWGSNWCNDGYTNLNYNDWECIWEVWSAIDDKTIIDQDKEDKEDKESEEEEEPQPEPEDKESEEEEEPEEEEPEDEEQEKSMCEKLFNFFF